MIETEIFSRLRKAIEKLPRECRKVFELCYFEGMNNEKAAQTLRISIETVKETGQTDTAKKSARVVPTVRLIIRSVISVTFSLINPKSPVK